MARILFAGTDGIGTNGTTQRMLFLARGMEEIGRPVDITLPDRIDNRNFCSEFLPKSRCRYFPLGNFYREILWKESLAKQYDCIHSFCIGTRFLIRPRNYSGFVVYDWDELLSSHQRCKISIRIKNKLVELLSLKWGNAFTVASPYLGTYIKQKTRNNAGIIELLNGYDPSIDRKLVHSEARERLVADHVNKRFLYVGAITRGYQIWELIRLAQLIRTSGLAFRLYVLGSGPDESAFRDAVRAAKVEDLVILLGRVPINQVSGCVAAADAMIFPFSPSLQNEARCPLKLFQYIASGKPVVTNSVGVAKIVLNEQGFFYEPGDASDMLYACKRAIHRGGRVGTARDTESLTWRSRAEGYYSTVSQFIPGTSL